MEFFLRYQGPLPTCSRTESRAKEKDFIRRKLSPQLEDLWKTHPGLSSWLGRASEFECGIKGRGMVELETQGIPSKPFGHVVFRGTKFIPLVVRVRRWICELKITFLRRHDPGDIVRGGDIDNRLKTLFDGLRIPYDESETKDSDDTQCFCLLEDDALISTVSIETERLWGPLTDQAKESDVEILMRVTIKKFNRSLDFI